MGRRAKPSKGQADARRSLARKAVKNLEKRLAEAVEQQTATAEILGVISRSQNDVQPVFDAIVRNAVRLCDAMYGDVYRFDGALVHFVAHHNFHPEQLVRWRQRFPRAPGGGIGRVIETGGVVCVSEVESDDGAVFGLAALELMHAHGTHSALLVPMSRNNAVIGVITLTHRRVGAFTGAHVELLQTFADQAVIAIENVRLFRELEARNSDLGEALEQQTATSEILGLIGTSPMDAQPVFDGIARSGVRVCGAQSLTLFVVDRDTLRVAATHGVPAERMARFSTQFPVPLSADNHVTQVLRERRIFHLVDIEHNPAATPEHIENARLGGYRTRLMVPMLRGDSVLGLVAVTHQAATPFSDQQVALLQTFADQAVIAIENVRLFTELQASNRELTTALDTQTATSDILRVISHSQTNVQPVFDAILASAVRLLGAHTGALTRITGDQIELAAVMSTDPTSDAALMATYPHSRQSEHPHAQAIRDRAPLNIADYQTDSRVPEASRAYSRVRGYRSVVVVPMLRHDEAVGAISVSRREPGGFTDDEIALLETFADQAVIAIENARLLTELHARTA